MKRLFLFALSCACAANLLAQSVGIGTNSPHVSAALEVSSPSKGLLPPRLTTTERNGIVSPAAGLVVFNTTTAALEVYNGTSWMPLYSGGRWGNRDVLSFENDEAEVYLNFHFATQEYGDYLGNCMDLWGDYLAISAYGDHSPDGEVMRMGSVRIFRKNGGRWAGSDFLYPAEQTTSANFGSDVAFDGPQLIVGAERAVSKNGQARGKAYVYSVAANGSFSLQDSLVSIEGKSNDYFGCSVGLSGNYAIVGAQQYDVPGKQDRGAAFIFVRTLNNQWLQHSILSPPDGQTEGLFGATVAISGNTAAITSIHASNNGYNRAGKVYLYQLVNNTWMYSTTLVSSGNSSYDKFGSDIYLKGDTLIIGSSQYNGDQGKTGKVYLYVRSNGVWNLQATLSPSDGRDGDGFGHSIFYNNGLLVVGAPYADVYAAKDQGKAYAFRLVNGAWVEEAVLAAKIGVANDTFGKSVAADGTTIFVGAPWATSRSSVNYGRVSICTQ